MSDAVGGNGGGGNGFKPPKADPRAVCRRDTYTQVEAVPGCPIVVGAVYGLRHGPAGERWRLVYDDVLDEPSYQTKVLVERADAGGPGERRTVTPANFSVRYRLLERPAAPVPTPAPPPATDPPPPPEKVAGRGAVSERGDTGPGQARITG